MKVKKEQEKVIYRCNGKVPYCKKSMCYKNKRLQTPDVCEHTSDIDYAENFVKMPGGGYYEDTSKYVLDKDVFEEHAEHQSKWIENVLWIAFFSSVTAVLTTLTITLLEE